MRCAEPSLHLLNGEIMGEGPGTTLAWQLVPTRKGCCSAREREDGAGSSEWPWSRSLALGAHTTQTHSGGVCICVLGI